RETAPSWFSSAVSCSAVSCKEAFRSLVRASLLLAGVMCLSPILSAQFSRATLLGQVTDSTNSAIPSARIRITRLETNESMVEMSDGYGTYAFAFMEPGTYCNDVSAKALKSL